MTRAQAIADIRQALACLRAEIALDNSAGYLSQNKLLENIICPVLAIVMDAPGLANANAVAANYAHIDLIDPKRKLAVQVTTTRDAAKITGTIKGFLKAKKHRKVQTLKFLVFSDPAPNYRPATAAAWKKSCRGKLSFDPARDVIDFNGLFRLIDNLNHAKLVKVRDLIAASVIGSEYVDVAAAYSGQAARQLDDEKASGKYIPDIFVETESAKSQARLFLHPFLFFEQVLDRCSRRRLALFNRLLEQCGLAAVPVFDRNRYKHDGTWAGLMATVDRLGADFTTLETAVTAYVTIEHDKPPPPSAKPCGRHYFDQNIHQLRSWVSGTNKWVTEMREELKIVRSRVFILTGKAGQGKTNFVCDVVERFALGHGIPCAYFTGLQLGRVSADLPEHICKTLFKDKVPAFSDAIKLLGDHAAGQKQPFVIFIDGLNEHTRLGQFAGQLEELIKTAIRHPSIRLFLTCRSEYFDQRFGALRHASFAADVHMLASVEQQMDERGRARLVTGYFKYFGIVEDLVSEQAAELLGKDTLLLRFFCEAYGARGKAAGYQMPRITHIYRPQIFDYYLETKLRSAAAARDRLDSTHTVRGTQANLFDVIKLIVGHMVTQRKFADVPLSAIPANKEADLVALLGEDIVIRRDLVADPAHLGAHQDVLNFTYDEFRDFLIARFLIQQVYPQGEEHIIGFLALGANGAENIAEGVKRFLFYWSRISAHADFRKFYSLQPAYAEAYPEEIFSVDEKNLDQDDRRRVRELIEAGGKVGGKAAYRLIFRLPARYPVLNIELLIEIVSARDDAFLDATVGEIFAPIHGWMEQHSQVEAHCDSIEKNILPRLDPAVHQPIFDFMPLLLPIEAEAGLESPGMRATRRFIAAAPSVTIKGLLRSLSYGPQSHRPYVWRLLSESRDHLPDTAATRTDAQAALAIANVATAREINRFLEPPYSP